MNVIQVGIGKTISLGNYESLRLDVRAEVVDGQEAAVALAEAETWLDEQIELRTGRKAQNEVTELLRDRSQLQRQVNERRQELAELEKRWATARALLQSHGVEVPDDLPF